MTRPGESLPVAFDAENVSELRSLFADQMRQRPGIWLPTPYLRSVDTWLHGLEMGCPATLVRMFWTWLVVRVGCEMSTGTPGLISHIAGISGTARTPAEDVHVWETFCDLMDEFLGEYAELGAAEGIATRYREWKDSDLPCPIHDC